MKFITFFILIFLLSPSFLGAATNYIGVTQTTSKNQLRVINSRLNSIGLKMLYKSVGNKYLVYSGPYRTSRSTSYAMQKIKKYFTNAKIITNKKIQQTSTAKVPARVKTQSKFNEIKQNNKNGYYIGTAIGYSSAPSTHSISKGSVTIKEPNNSGMHYLIDGGYNFENGFSLSLAYMILGTGDLAFSNIYTTVNYRFGNFKYFTPYFGVLAGFSSLKWNVDPILNASEASNNDSASFIGGTQVGVIYNGYKNISLLLSYKSIIMGHTTNIEVDANNISQLQHKVLHSIEVGIQYNF